MTRVLIYGDSNAMGLIPGSAGRHPRFHPIDIHWPQIAAKRLGRDVDLRVDARIGRIAGVNGKRAPKAKNGFLGLRSSLRQNWPIDHLIISLGTNDLNATYGANARQIAEAVRKLVLHARALGMHRNEIIMVPIRVDPVHANARIFPDIAHRQFGIEDEFTALGKSIGVTVFDTNQWAHPSPDDGVHLDPSAHINLGNGFATGLQGELARCPRFEH